MTRRIELRPRARKDLRDIADYTDARWGRTQARIYLGALADALGQIAERPDAGSDRSDVSAGLRKWRSGEHSIYYRVVEEAVVVSRIVHVRMDLGGVEWER
ncbi:type II toxin-antitoxin system RelE/ParE family toxin [Sphingomonas sp.]|uniref:type II toxin-antitoxin system RelE/ParE family toxin n=1 Tax=Sphingomonas sp. TaxID=28214 RepID=UPI001EC9CA0C|nr:type II toxin-antitoxin system RelE/ParE family toxin [Sphingomonas sp.]MBX3593232.1 type II toxin-antitoxin system RelE/ParE family toxin [Sphingomonas sp.]